MFESSKMYLGSQRIKIMTPFKLIDKDKLQKIKDYITEILEYRDNHSDSDIDIAIILSNFIATIEQLMPIKDVDGSELRQAIANFSTAMYTKFEARKEKYGDRSIVFAGSKYLNGPEVKKELIEKIKEEYKELEESNWSDEWEAVDLSNTGLLLWWHLQLAKKE